MLLVMVLLLLLLVPLVFLLLPALLLHSLVRGSLGPLLVQEWRCHQGYGVFRGRRLADLLALVAP